jgi:Zn-dependent protease
MDANTIIDGLLFYIGLVILLTFHEFGHAWMASKCGDDTARLQGRVSINPLVHMDLIGTVILPLFMIFGPAKMGQYLIGWAKPVPVNLNNLRNPRMDDILITMAGPWMNLFLAVVLVGLARVGELAGVPAVVDVCKHTASISLLLFFFNLIPIPPLDGSRIARVILNLSYETYVQIARFGFVAVIVVLQIPLIRQFLINSTDKSLSIICGWFGVN